MNIAAEITDATLTKPIGELTRAEIEIVRAALNDGRSDEFTKRLEKLGRTRKWSGK